MNDIRDASDIDWRTLAVRPEWKNYWSAHSLQRKWKLLEDGIPGHENMPFSGMFTLSLRSNACSELMCYLVASEIVKALSEKHPAAPIVKKTAARAGEAGSKTSYKSKEVIEGEDSENLED